MTELLENAIARLRRLPETRQDEAAELLLSVVEQDPETVKLDVQQVAEVQGRLKEPTKSVTHAEVRTFFDQSAV